MRTLLRKLTEYLRCGQDAIVCQVVETRGSTPQKAGALMLVTPDGSQFGTLGGGCVEAEVKQKAMRLLSDPGARIDTFVLDHDYAWADGLICGGKMVILSECPRGSEALRYYQTYHQLLEAGRGLTEGIVIDSERAGGVPFGTRTLFDSDGRSASGLGTDVFPDRRPESLEIRPRPSVREGIAWLPTLPRVRLLIVGAGHVGQAVAELAARADFDVWVIDDRGQYANSDRFPTAQRLLVGNIEEVLRSLEYNKHTYALIVTRGHGHDQEALYHLAPTSSSYIGLIGSKRKIRMIFDGLREMGITEQSLARVSAPVGLDIGSESVTEIAVSITAELIARRNLTQSRREAARPPIRDALA
jgi:xanthine dehydrogenase accessory factor